MEKNSNRVKIDFPSVQIGLGEAGDIVLILSPTPSTGPG